MTEYKSFTDDDVDNLASLLCADEAPWLAAPVLRLIATACRLKAERDMALADREAEA